MRMLPTAMAVAAAGLLTACGSTHAPASSSPVSSVSSGTPASPSAAPQAAQATQATLPGSRGLAVCRSASLKIALDTSQAGAAMGSAYYPVDFTNTAATPCGLYGYPGMSLVTAASGSGRQIGAAAQENPSFSRLTVRLPAGGVAHAWLQVAQAGNYPASTCDPATAHVLRVYPPGDTVARYVSVRLSTCASASTPILTVTPMRSGHGERGVTP